MEFLHQETWGPGEVCGLLGSIFQPFAHACYCFSLFLLSTSRTSSQALALGVEYESSTLQGIFEIFPQIFDHHRFSLHFGQIIKGTNASFVQTDSPGLSSVSINVDKLICFGEHSQSVQLKLPHSLFCVSTGYAPLSTCSRACCKS